MSVNDASAKNMLFHHLNDAFLAPFASILAISCALQSAWIVPVPSEMYLHCRWDLINVSWLSNTDWIGAVAELPHVPAMGAFFLFFDDLMVIGSDMNWQQKALEVMIKYFIARVGFFVFNASKYVCVGVFEDKLSVPVPKSHLVLLI